MSIVYQALGTFVALGVVVGFIVLLVVPHSIWLYLRAAREVIAERQHQRQLERLAVELKYRGHSHGDLCRCCLRRLGSGDGDAKPHEAEHRGDSQ